MNSETAFHHQVQRRRYGGDLQGVMDQLDHLSELGINAVYFNPLNDAPSLHKYDARHYRHIDRNFGPDPDGDAAIMAAEVPADPATWRWTSADRLFLRLIDSLHARHIRVIMDYSFNHTGTSFWAFEDLRRRGAASPYRDWYHVDQLDDPATPEDEFAYRGWVGIQSLPEFQKDIVPPSDDHFPFEGNLSSPSLKQHLFAVVRRWLDPNGDGDPSDGVDGYRLDVAAEIPQGFWRDVRREVRAVNPEAYLIGEVWWYEWPDSLLAPQQFLQGDQFDAVMNYRWYRAARGFLAQVPPLTTPSQFVAHWNALTEGLSPLQQQVMMNMSASHDAPRLSTSLFNHNLYKYMASPSADATYRIHRPDAHAWQLQQLLLIHQMTFPGAPQIWNGDELGMWGADDPDCRKPITWPDLDFEAERAHALPQALRPVDRVEADLEKLAFYQRMTRLRSQHPLLATAALEFLLADDSTGVLAYRRHDGDQELLIILNRDADMQPVSIPLPRQGTYRDLLSPSDIWYQSEDRQLTLALPGLSALVLERTKP
jgi:glycosidase